MVLISIVSSYLHSNKLHSVHSSSLSAGGGGKGWVEPSTKFSKRRSLTGSQSSDLRISESGCWERWGYFLQWGSSFYIENNLKSEVLNDKKGL